MRVVHFASATVVASLSLASPSLAQNFLDGLTIGASVTTNSIDAGVSSTDNGFGASAFIDKSFGLLYAGLEIESVVEDGENDGEMSLNIGIRPEIGDLEFDLGYSYSFLLRNAEGEEGEHELHAAVEWEANDWLGIEGELEWSPVENELTVEGELELQLRERLALIFGAGLVRFEEEDEVDYAFWHAGVNFSLTDRLDLTLAYSDTNLSEDECDDMFDGDLCGPAVFATLSWEWMGGGGPIDDDDLLRDDED